MQFVGLKPCREQRGHESAVDGFFLLQALKAALDSIAVGTVFADRDARILYANRTARLMLTARTPIVSLGGELSALHTEATRELKDAIASTLEGPGTDARIGIPLVNRDLTVAMAYVLPLTRSDVYSSAVTKAASAVFVASANAESRFDISAIGRTFRLTPAETRLLSQLSAGATLTEAAVVLGVTEATAKAHRNNIYMKTGVSRRTDLLSLISQLIPPLFKSKGYQPEGDLV
jgi:DNA-binding CsgD family transcriptional regulator